MSLSITGIEFTNTIMENDLAHTSVRLGLYRKFPLVTKIKK